MPEKAALLVLTLGLGVMAQKSRLTLDPPWSTVFRDESVILTSSGPHFPPWSSTWYRDDKYLGTKYRSNFRIEKAKMSDAGRYQCKVPDFEQSDPIQLMVSNEWLILQVPYYAVFEGDPLHLRCYGWRGQKVSGIKYYRNEEEVKQFHDRSELFISKAKTSDSGSYKCTGLMKTSLLGSKESSPEVSVSVQELFSTPVLQAEHSAEPTEGSPVTLTCVTQFNPQKSDTGLRTIFYKDNQTMIEFGYSLKYHIPAAQLEDSGSYYCVVRMPSSSVRKWSPRLQIAVKRIPVSGVSLGVQPLGGQVTEGERLVLSCSVAEGTGLLTFSWHRQGSTQALRSDSQHSHKLDYEIPAAMENDTGEYYCTVSNGNTAAPSPAVKVAVKVPVSTPVLTISAAGAWAAVGDVVEIQCESPRGSAPILYRFLHEGVSLGNRTVSSRGPGSFALNVTSEQDAGTYSCEADNGLANGSWRSAPFHLSVLVPVSGATIVADRSGAEVIAGETLNLSCLVESGTTPQFKWLHNTQELDVVSGLSLPMPVGNTLHFESVQLGHGGNYQCVASNQLNHQRVFQTSSEILAITVIENPSARVAGTATVSFLCLIGVIVALVYYFMRWKKADGSFFKSQERDTGPPAQHEAPDQRRPPRESGGLHGKEPSYSNVCPLQLENGDVAYAVVNFKKRNGDTPNRAPPSDSEDCYISYCVLSDSKPPCESGAGAKAPEGGSQPRSDIYENFVPL